MGVFGESLGSVWEGLGGLRDVGGSLRVLLGFPGRYLAPWGLLEGSLETLGGLLAVPGGLGAPLRCMGSPLRGP